MIIIYIYTQLNYWVIIIIVYLIIILLQSNYRWGPAYFSMTDYQPGSGWTIKFCDETTCNAWIAGDPQTTGKNMQKHNLLYLFFNIELNMRGFGALKRP